MCMLYCHAISPGVCSVTVHQDGKMVCNTRRDLQGFKDMRVSLFDQFAFTVQSRDPGM